MIEADVGTALLLSTLAGLSTGIGSFFALFIRKPKLSYLIFSLGFSAGVMLYVSFVELLPSALEEFDGLMAVVPFFLGILLIGAIDMMMPKRENPHDYGGLTEATNNGQLMRTGMFTAMAIAIHNFPEGLATFGTALGDPALGGVIALAIAIHNIPEGVSVSMPIYYATGDKKKSFMYSFLSGVAEPVGAIIGFAVLFPFLTESLLAALLTFVAGIMVYISLDELLPTALEHTKGHKVIIGVVLGMLVMAISLSML
ncbi:MAG: zinc transporter ZupT [Methanomassiliicoccales archaeon]